MIDMQNEQKYNAFGYVKSKWKTEYNELIGAKLNQVIRRKSCYC